VLRYVTYVYNVNCDVFTRESDSACGTLLLSAQPPKSSLSPFRIAG